MKKIFTTLTVVLFTVCLFSQAPQKMSYQAVIRNSSNSLVASSPVGIRVSILQGSASGTPVYIETQTPITNANGLATIEIGAGTVVSGTFAGINWAAGPYFIKTETDPAGATNYNISGTSQLLSVPYALYAKDVQNGTKPGGVSGNVQFNNSADFSGDANFHWDNTNKRLGIGTASPVAMLQVYDLNNNRQIAVSDWADMSAGTGGYGLFASNAYLNNSLNTLHFSNTHASLGASGIIFNYPFWHTTTIFVNEPGGGSVKDQPFTPTAIASFKSGEVNVYNNKITNVANPVNAQDAATKAYVDILIGQLSKTGTIVVDADGNIYPTVRIGSQLWMAENLKTTKYNDGTSIPNVTDNTAWAALTTGAYSWYNNDATTYKATYGALYNWYAVDNNAATKAASNGSKNVCPTGWHIPTDAEWTTLTDYLTNSGYGYQGSGSDIGKSMASTSGWTTYTTAGTVGNDQASNNSSGFTALPGGFRDIDGTYYIGYYGYWWSSTEDATAYPWFRDMGYSNATVSRITTSKWCGFSVRCVRDF